MNSFRKASFPDEWDLVALDKVVDRIRGRDDPQDFQKLPYIGLKHIEEDSMDLLGKAKAKEYKSTSVHFYPGDILYGRLRPYLNKVHLAKFEGLGSGEIIVLTPKDNVLPQYLSYVLNSQEFVRFANHRSTGDRPRVNYNKIKEFELPLPPIEKQKNIVAKIEELFSKLDSGVDDLEIAAKRIGQYERALLKEAMEGELTHQWRDESEFSNVDTLLQDLRDENDELTGRYRHDDPIEYGNIDIPDGWRLIRLSEVAKNIQYGYTESAEEENVGPKYLRITDIQDGQVNWNDTPYCEIGDELGKYLLRENDLLFARTGATVGKSVLIENDPPEAVFASYLIRIQLKEHVLPEYVYAFFNSAHYWRQIHEGKVGVGQPNVNATKLSRLALPLPPFEEQAEIANIVNRKLSIKDDVEATITKETQRANHLRKTILKTMLENGITSKNREDKKEKDQRTDARNKDVIEQKTLQEVTQDAE